MTRTGTRPAGDGTDRARREPAGPGPRPPADEGSAVVEFLGVTLVLLVPLVYLVLVLGQLQAAAFAVDGAAREAVRAVTSAAGLGTPSDPGPPAGARAVRAVGIALADQGIDVDPVSALDLVCEQRCTAPGSGVAATVRVEVGLPLVPDALRSVVPLSVPVTAHAEGRVERFAQERP